MNGSALPLSKSCAGPFPVLLFDQRKKQWLAAVDGFGIKRLAYYRDDNVFFIASRVDALTRCGEVDLEINPRSIANVLNFSTNLAPETIFTKVHRLIPGAILTVSDLQIRIEQYWGIHYGVGGHSSEANLSRELERVVEGSVADQCKGAPVAELGAFLSGGTDSSTVLGMMTRAVQAPVKSFSIGYEEHAFNELDYARIAAKKFQSDHHTYLVGARRLLRSAAENDPLLRRALWKFFSHPHILLRASGSAKRSESASGRGRRRRIVWRERTVRDR